MKKIYFFIAMLAMNMSVKAQISISVIGNAYTENFNTLANTGTSSTIPAGWAFSESGSNANSTYTAGTGSSTTGDTYSFGALANTERAFGGLRTGSLVPVIGANYVNNTGSMIIALSISYTGEQWRLGAIGRVDRLDFQYSLDATGLTTGTWTDVNALDFIAPVTSGSTGALDGNAAANRSAINGLITGLSISNGSSFWIRWTDLDAVGSDDGLGVDDFSIMVPIQTPTPVELLRFSGQKGTDQNILRWTTATEINNRGFEIQRSFDGINYSVIGFVNSSAPAGNSSDLLSYQFIDSYPIGNKQYYRLRQEDRDGRSKLSNIVLIRGNQAALFTISGLFPNPSGTIINLLITTPRRTEVTIVIMDITGRVAGSKTANLETGNNTIAVDISRFRSGRYFVKLVCNDDALRRGCETAVAEFIKQ